MSRQRQTPHFIRNWLSASILLVMVDLLGGAARPTLGCGINYVESKRWDVFSDTPHFEWHFQVIPDPNMCDLCGHAGIDNDEAGVASFSATEPAVKTFAYNAAVYDWITVYYWPERGLEDESYRPIVGNVCDGWCDDC